MQNHRKLWRWIGGSFLLMILLSLAVFLYHYRPIFATTRYTALVSTPQLGWESATVYSMLGRPSWLFIRVPKSHLDPERQYEWYGFDATFQLITWGRADDSPFPHHRHDQGMGIELESAKMEDDWKVERHPDSVEFSNGRVAFSVKRQHE